MTIAPELIQAGYDFAVRRVELERLTSYTELSAMLTRRILHRSTRVDRKTVSHVCAAMSRRSVGECGAMLSAMVVHLDDNDPGDEFYNFARELGLDPGNTMAEHTLFHQQQIQALRAHYGAGIRP